MAYKNYWMRNQSPENGSAQVPWHLQAEWHEVIELVRNAAKELNEIDELYRQAILARLSLGASLSDAETWEDLKQARSDAQKYYVEAIKLRHNFTKKVNGEL